MVEHTTENRGVVSSILTLATKNPPQIQLSPDVTIALYRIAQEAMNNVVRHSKAGRAWVTLGCSDGLVKLTVGDDGSGFEESLVGPERFGLRIMRNGPRRWPRL